MATETKIDQYKVVFDYVGRFKNKWSEFYYKGLLEKRFVRAYNTFCGLTNPKFDEWNNQWNGDFGSVEYRVYIAALQEQIIRNNEILFLTGNIKSFYYDFDKGFSAYVDDDDIGRFIMSFHLEKV